MHPPSLAALFLCVLAPAISIAENAWEDTYRNQTWPTSTASCVQGEVEPRIAALRAANPSILYRWRTVAVNEYLPDEESQCNYVIERRVGFVWVTQELGSPVHFNIGGVDPCPEGTLDSTGYCMPKNPGPPACPTNQSNPIDSGTANKYQREDDYLGAGAYPLMWTRHYNSLNTLSGPLGNNWRHYYQRSVAITAVSGDNATAVKVYRDDGKRYDFTLVGGIWQPAADVSFKLVQLFSGSNPNGWRLTTAQDEIETYNSQGQLIAIVQRSGITQTLSYDGDGRLTTVADPHGRQLSLGYDANSRINAVTIPGGSAVSYGYDASNRLTSVTYPGTTSRTYLYNEPSLTGGANLPRALTGIQDESGLRFANFEYDAQLRALRSEHAGGVGRVTIAYGAGGARTVTDPLNTARTYTYSTVLDKSVGTGVSQYSSACGPDNKVIQYDVNGNVSARTDYFNVETRYGYDLTRNLETSRTEAFGTPRARTVSTQHHATFRIPTQIDEPGKRTTYTHDANGNVETKTELDIATNTSRTWTYAYNGIGQVLTVNGPRTDVSDQTTYTYHSSAATCTATVAGASATGCRGQLETVTNALSQPTTFNEYNAHGQALKITDPNGVVTTLGYDARQRLTSRTVGTEQTTFEYWPPGLLKKVVLPDNSFLQYTYDVAHRLTEIEDADGNRIVYLLDNMGNRTAEEMYDPANALTETRTRVFNTLNQLWKEIGAAGTAAVTTTFAYDNNGNQTAINAPFGRNTVQVYDELNRLKQMTDPASGITQYGYNALDQLTSVTDPEDLITGYTYNALGDLLMQASPDTGTTTHTYDSAGNLQTRTDARGASIGHGVYTYDALNRVTQIEYPDHTITYAYDSCPNGVGRLCGMTDASGSTSYEYDARGRVTRKSQSTPLGGGTHTRIVRYDYANGHLTAVRMAEGQRINYSYDVAGRISAMSITWPDNSTSPLLSNVLYDPVGRVRGWTWANGTFEVREYDQDGRITDIDNAGASQYGYDDADRITSISSLAGNTSPSWSYGYDPLDRLTGANRAGLAETFSYDANGNRLTQGGTQASAYSYSTPLTSNRLQSVSGAVTRTYSYDATGNVTGNGIVSFDYNGAGRMSSAGSMTYRYNGLGERTAKSPWPNLWTTYLYDEAGHLLEKCDVYIAGQCKSFFSTQYIWLGDIPIAALLPHIEYNEEGYVSVFYVGLYNVHTDHLNTPRRLTQENGAVVLQWDPDPFGIGHPNINVLGPYDFDLRFPGQIFDSENWPWLHYNYFRDYDPEAGRYVQSDPIGIRGGVNTYSYVVNDPIGGFDKFGLLTCQGRWRQQGELVPTIPTPTWQTFPFPWCFCYWVCTPCRGPSVWSGDIYSLPSTKGTTIFSFSSNRRVSTGNAGTRPTPSGPNRGGGGSSSAGGSPSCACKRPGPETGCNDGQCHVDSNFNE